MPAPPGISVIIPAYNCAGYLPEAIESVLAQTLEDYELIVVDDGSTDGTEKVVKRYGDRVRYLRQENRGPGAAKNLGIRNCRGSLIATLDADDKWRPEKLAIQYEYMSSHPEVGLVYSDASSFDAKGIRTIAYNKNYRRVFQGMVFDRLILKNFIASITIMVRKECLDRVGLFPENFMISEDWHLWLRIAREYPIGYIDQPLAMYRLQEKSLTWDYPRAYPDRMRVLDEMAALYPDYFERNKRLISKARGGVLMRYGYALFHAGDYGNSRTALLGSIRKDPLQLKSYLYLAGLLVPPWLRIYITRVKSRLGIKFMPAE